MFILLGYSEVLEKNQEVCIHPGNRKKTFFSQVDQTKVHLIKRDEQDQRVKGKALSFFKMTCFLPITIVEECQSRMK